MDGELWRLELYSLTASLVDNPSVSAQAGLTVVSAGSPGLLGTGWFTFYLTGSDNASNNGDYAVMGSVYLNGSGAITPPPGGTGSAGEEDFLNTANISSVMTSVTGGATQSGRTAAGV